MVVSIILIEIFQRDRRRLPANSDSCEGSSSSDSEPSQEESTQWKTHQTSRRKPQSSSLRVRELRNRFVCNVGLSAYSTRRRTQEVAIRDCKRNYPPSPPPRQIMPEDSDSNFMIERDNESDEIFSPFRRSHRKRVPRQPERREINRRERYLRPLKNQSYAEYQHSSMHSDSDNENRRGDTDGKPNQIITLKIFISIFVISSEKHPSKKIAV